MKYAKHWGAIASHSGDCYFDFIYKAEWLVTLTALQRYAPGTQPPKQKQAKQGHDDGRIKRFLEYTWQTERPSGSDITVLMMICMAATYDPDPQAPLGFRLPYDLNTGEFLERRWQKWLKHDPVHLAPNARAKEPGAPSCCSDGGEQLDNTKEHPRRRDDPCRLFASDGGNSPQPVGLLRTCRTSAI